MKTETIIRERPEHKFNGTQYVNAAIYHLNEIVREKSWNAYNSEPKFESVVKRITSRYYVGGISRDSNRAGLVEYLTERGITPVSVNLLKANANDSVLMLLYI
jgi:hypothetical protein